MSIVDNLSIICSITSIIVNIYTIWMVRKFWINTAKKTAVTVSDGLAKAEDVVRDIIK
jgi:hypothetical protein